MAKKEILKELLKLSGLSLILAFLVNAISPHGIAPIGQWDKKKGVVTARAKDDTVNPSREIGLEEALAAYQAGAVFLDARSFEQYSQGHIKNAVSLPVETIWETLPEFADNHSENTHFITYCNGVECPDSHDLADALFEAGYTNVKVFAEGYPAWKDENLPVAP